MKTHHLSIQLRLLSSYQAYCLISQMAFNKFCYKHYNKCIKDYQFFLKILSLSKIINLIKNNNNKNHQFTHMAQINKSRVPSVQQLYEITKDSNNKSLLVWVETLSIWSYNKEQIEELQMKILLLQDYMELQIQQIRNKQKQKSIKTQQQEIRKQNLVRKLKYYIQFRTQKLNQIQKKQLQRSNYLEIKKIEFQQKVHQEKLTIQKKMLLIQQNNFIVSKNGITSSQKIVFQTILSAIFIAFLTSLGTFYIMVGVSQYFTKGQSCSQQKELFHQLKIFCLCITGFAGAIFLLLLGIYYCYYFKQDNQKYKTKQD